MRSSAPAVTLPKSAKEIAMPSTGQCLCGAIGYTLKSPAVSVLECHCSICRRQSGAASVVYAAYRRHDVAMSGTLKFYRASAIAKRGFCANCGSTISYDGDDDRGLIWLTAGTHNDAGSLPQREHMHAEDKLAWVDIPKAHTQWRHAPERS
jgi:hypothetical protein